MAVNNRVHDVILTAMDNLVIPRVVLAVRSITGSSGHGPKSVVQYPDQENSSGNMENTPLMTASSRIDTNINKDKKDETRNVENFEDGHFPALRLKCDRQSHTHHSIFTYFHKLVLKQ